MSYESDVPHGLHRQGGTVRGKFTSFRVFDPKPWHVGMYIMGHWDPTDWKRNVMVDGSGDLAGGRPGKVIAVNKNAQYPGVFTIVIEHPYEPLPRQDFPEWRAMRHFDRVALEVHDSVHRNIPG